MKGRYSLPSGWTDYKACGEVIPGTRFVAFKTPLRQEYNNALKGSDVKDGHHSTRFSPRDCAMDVYDRSRGRYRLGLVLNLTFTDKYYNPADFDRERVYFGKIMCPGHEIPNDSLVHEFRNSVLNYFYDYPDPSMVIGVHCTHGVNRTGYMIARYLIQVDGWPVDDAITAVGKARGYPIERENYLAHLHNLDKPSSLYPKVTAAKDEPKTENSSGLQIFDGSEVITSPSADPKGPDICTQIENGPKATIDNGSSDGSVLVHDHSSDKTLEIISEVSSDNTNAHILLSDDLKSETVSKDQIEMGEGSIAPEEMGENSIHLPQEIMSEIQDEMMSVKRTLDEPETEATKVAKMV